MDITQPKALKPIEIFKPGRHPATNGQVYSFTAANVCELAETYNPEFADAPLVVGHPKLTSPRFGRAEKLFVNASGVLCAVPGEVVPEFAEAVNAKQYPKVSASIYLPNAPGNPTPGKYYLRHIGFLGGVAPAVKGLKSVEFASSDEGIVDFACDIADFAYEDRLVVRLFRRMREWIVAKEGAEKAQEVIPDYDLDYLTENAVREEVQQANAIPGFSSPNPKQEDALNTAEQLAIREAALTAEKQQLDARAANIAKQEAALKKTGFADFAEGLVKEGKLLPAQTASVVEIMAQLDAVNQVADFAEGDENHGKTGAALFQAFLSAQPKQVEYNRVSQQNGKTGGTADFAAPEGMQVDAEGLETLNKANAYMKEHPGTDFIDAVKAVQAT
jgi:hypothetical protein